MKRGFTLVEMLLVMAILTVLAAITMSALNNLGERAKEERTKTIIKRIDSVFVDSWEAYRNRPMPFRMPGNIKAGTAAIIKMRAIRDLQRMELPERPTDIDPRIGPNATNPVDPVNLTHGLTDSNMMSLATLRLSKPASFQRYQRVIAAQPVTWADQYAQGELLHLILSGMRSQDGGNVLDFLSPSEIGDRDGDGMKEILDGWGEPIWFLRWPVGYTKENGADTQQASTTGLSKDPFDPYSVDTDGGYALRPLVFSSGQDRLMGVYLEANQQMDRNKDIRYADPMSGYYPLRIFRTPVASSYQEAQTTASVAPYFYDNITNHGIEQK